MTESSESHIPAPVLSSTAPSDIHLSYLRRDVDEMKRTLSRSFEEVNTTLKEIKDGHPTRVEFVELTTNVSTKTEDHEGRIRVIEQALWKYVGWSSAIAAFVSLVGSYLLNQL